MQIMVVVNHRSLLTNINCAQGITDEALAAELPSVSHQERANIVNKLSNSKRIQLFEKGKSVVYKEVTAEEAAKYVPMQLHAAHCTVTHVMPASKHLSLHPA